MPADWVHSLILATTVQSLSPSTRAVAEAVKVEEAPHGCLEQERLAHHVSAWLGGAPIDARIRIEVRGDPARPNVAHFRVWRARELVVDRAFEPLPPDCESTHAALGLAIAIAVESTILDAFIGEKRPEIDSANAPQGAMAEEQTARADEGSAASSWEGLEGIGLRMSAVSAFGLHPMVGFGGQFLTELWFPRLLALRLGGLATRGLRTEVGEGGAVLSWVAARTDLCIGGISASTRLQGCVGAAFGPAIAAGRDLDVTQTTVTPWVAVVPGFAVTVPVNGPVAFALDLDFVAPLVRPDLIVTTQGSDEVAARRRLPPVGGMVSLGLVIQFPARAR